MTSNNVYAESFGLIHIWTAFLLVPATSGREGEKSSTFSGRYCGENRFFPDQGTINFPGAGTAWRLEGTAFPSRKSDSARSNRRSASPD
jgi:hypothetical protein